MNRPHNPKRGSKYRLLVGKHRVFEPDIAKGSIVVLHYNDNSNCPFFKEDANNNDSSCIRWKDLEPYILKNVIGGSLIEEVSREGGKLL